MTERDEQIPAATTTAALDRRRVLRGAAFGVGGAALGIGLAGCGSDSSTVEPAASTATGATSAATSAGPEVLGKASDVPVGGGTIFSDQKVVVTQPTAGDFKAFSAVCTHQGCLVSSISGDAIVCPCHGSQYSIEDGSVLGGPAPSPLSAEQITVKGGDITLA